MFAAIAPSPLNLTPIQRLLTLAAGDFSLLIIRANTPHTRHALRQSLPRRVPVITLHPAIVNPLAVLHPIATALNPAAILVDGFEDLADLPRLATITNQLRADWRSQLPCPILLVMGDRTWAQFRRLAPDFCTWASTTHALPADALTP